MKKTMIVRLFGGLGNQMFQYATAVSISHKISHTIKLDISSFPNDSLRSFSLRCFNIDAEIATTKEIQRYYNIFNKIIDKLYSRLRLGYYPFYVKEKIQYFDKRILSLSSIKYIDGYWHSEKYFKDIRPLLLKEFSLRTPFDIIKSRFSNISDTSSVSVHVRRGDYISNKTNLEKYVCCDKKYYVDAIDYLMRYINDPVFFVFSDDIVWVKNNLPIPGKVIYVSNPELKDYSELYLMSQCKYNIIANSTFSWWAGWLNTFSDKIIISPKKWFNHKREINGLIPDDWILI